MREGDLDFTETNEMQQHNNNETIVQWTVCVITKEGAQPPLQPIFLFTFTETVTETQHQPDRSNLKWNLIPCRLLEIARGKPTHTKKKLHCSEIMKFELLSHFVFNSRDGHTGVSLLLKFRETTSLPHCFEGYEQRNENPVKIRQVHLLSVRHEDNKVFGGYSEGQIDH